MTRHPHRLLRRSAPFALMVAVAFGAPWSAAENTDRQQPINYSSDTGDVNYQTKIGSLAGNVVITQGTLTIRADRIVFRQNPDNSMSATAYGNPVSFRQKRDGYDEYFEGYAQRAEYDGTRQLLELFDRALLKRGQDEIRSSYISYNSATEQFKAEGRDKGAAPAPGAAADTRVRGVFQPKSDTPLAGKGKELAPGDKAPVPPLPLKPAGEMTAPAAK